MLCIKKEQLQPSIISLQTVFIQSSLSQHQPAHFVLSSWSSALCCARNGCPDSPAACPTHWAASALRWSCPTHRATGVTTASPLQRPRSTSRRIQSAVVTTPASLLSHFVQSNRSSEASALRCVRHGCLGSPTAHPTHWATRLPRFASGHARLTGQLV